ncbi:MAG: hypothetical protein V1887_02885 [Candidatus Aenigmatarchaeota archaeon]
MVRYLNQLPAKSAQPLQRIGERLADYANRTGCREYGIFCQPSYGDPDEEHEESDVDIGFAVDMRIWNNGPLLEQIYDGTDKIALEEWVSLGREVKIWPNPIDNFKSTKDFRLPPTKRHVDDIRHGIDSIANKAILYRMLKGSVYIGGRDVLGELSKKSEHDFEMANPRDGYDMFAIATADLATGVLNCGKKKGNGKPFVDNHKLGKGIIFANYGLHLLCERKYLATYKEMADSSEEIFHLRDNDIENLVKSAPDMRKAGNDTDDGFDMTDAASVSTLQKLFNFARAKSRAEAMRLRYHTDVQRMTNLKDFYDRMAPNIAKMALQTPEQNPLLFFFAQEVIDYLGYDALSTSVSGNLPDGYLMKEFLRNAVVLRKTVLPDPRIKDVIMQQNDPWPKAVYGRAYAVLGDWNDAIANLAGSIAEFEGQKTPDSDAHAYSIYTRPDKESVLSDLYATLAFSLLKTGKHKDAESAIDSSLSNEPLNPTHLRLKAVISGNKDFHKLAQAAEKIDTDPLALYKTYISRDGISTHETMNYFSGKLKSWMIRNTDAEIAKYTAEKDMLATDTLEGRKYQEALEIVENNCLHILESLRSDALKIRGQLDVDPSPARYPLMVSFYKSRTGYEEEVYSLQRLALLINNAHNADRGMLGKKFEEFPKIPQKDQSDWKKDLSKWATERGFEESISDWENTMTPGKNAGTRSRPQGK